MLGHYLRAGGKDSNAWRRPDGKPARLQFESAEARLEGRVPNQKLQLDLRLSSNAPHRPGFIAVDILNSLGASVMQALPTVEPFITQEHRTHLVRLTIDLPPLIPGHYSLAIWVGPHNSETFDFIARAVGFEIETSPTKNRTYGHTADHGYVVPHSTCEYLPSEVFQP